MFEGCPQKKLPDGFSIDQSDPQFINYNLPITMSPDQGAERLVKWYKG